MKKIKRIPRNKVFPFRANEEEAALIVASVPKGLRATFFLNAVIEKIRTIETNEHSPDNEHAESPDHLGPEICTSEMREEAIYA